MAKKRTKEINLFFKVQCNSVPQNSGLYNLEDY